MKVLILGSEGFIGRRVRQALLTSGHQVAGIDLRPTADVVGNARAYLLGLLDDYRPDAVLHLAALVTRAACEQRPTEAVRENVELTAFVASACATRGIRLAYASTSEVYGDYGTLEVDESVEPRPTSGVYGMTKFWGEQLARHYCERPLIMRLCMAYGPDMPVGPGKAALPTFIYNAIRGRPIIVHRGAQRSWCWGDDVARAIGILIEQDRDGIWNVGRDDEVISMLDVAQYACLLAGAGGDSLIDVVDPPSLQTVVKLVSCAKLVRETGWRPEVSIVSGMRACYRALAPELGEQVA